MEDERNNEMFKRMDSMYTEALRLESFKNWPFSDKSPCSSLKMAEAGFFHCPSAEYPDAVQCFVCFKELDGWEETDEPWSEHLSHSKICLFAQMKKPQKDLTVNELFKIEAERKKSKVRRFVANRVSNFKASTEEMTAYIQELTKSLTKSKRRK